MSEPPRSRRWLLALPVLVFAAGVGGAWSLLERQVHEAEQRADDLHVATSKLTFGLERLRELRAVCDGDGDPARDPAAARIWARRLEPAFGWLRALDGPDEGAASRELAQGRLIAGLRALEPLMRALDALQRGSLDEAAGHIEQLPPATTLPLAYRELPAAADAALARMRAADGKAARELERRRLVLWLTSRHAPRERLVALIRTQRRRPRGFGLELRALPAERRVPALLEAIEPFRWPATVFRGRKVVERITAEYAEMLAHSLVDPLELGLVPPRKERKRAGLRRFVVEMLELPMRKRLVRALADADRRRAWGLEDASHLFTSSLAEASSSGHGLLRASELRELVADPAEAAAARWLLAQPHILRALAPSKQPLPAAAAPALRAALDGGLSGDARQHATALLERITAGPASD